MKRPIPIVLEDHPEILEALRDARNVYAAKAEAHRRTECALRGRPAGVRAGEDAAAVESMCIRIDEWIWQVQEGRR